MNSLKEVATNLKDIVRLKRLAHMDGKHEGERMYHCNPNITIEEATAFAEGVVAGVTDCISEAKEEESNG